MDLTLQAVSWTAKMRRTNWEEIYNIGNLFLTRSNDDIHNSKLSKTKKDPIVKKEELII